MKTKSMSDIRWSIIVPVYRVEQFLGRCMDSICCQLTDEVELILVDDGSDDRCPEICDLYAQTYNNIKVIHKENGGLGDARNAGIDIAEGEIVTFIDSDDDVHDNYVSEIFSLYQKNRNTLVFSFNMVVVRSNGEIDKTEMIIDNEECIEINRAVLRLEKWGIFNSAWNKVYIKEALNQEPKIRFVPRSEPIEDVLFNCEYFGRITKVDFANTPLYNYYRQGDIERSLSHKYWSGLFQKTKLLCETREKMYSALGLETEADLVELANQNVYAVYKCIPNMYRVGKKEKIDVRIETYKKMLSWELLESSINRTDKNDFVVKQFCYLYSSHCPILMDIIYLIEFSLHYSIIPSIKKLFIASRNGETRKK